MDAEDLGDLRVDLGAVLDAAEPPQHESRCETDLGDDDDEAEEQRAVPFPPVQRDDHVDAAADERSDAREPGDDLHGVLSSPSMVTWPVSPLTVTTAPSGRSSVARRVTDDRGDACFPGEDREV